MATTTEPAGCENMNKFVNDKGEYQLDKYMEAFKGKILKKIGDDFNEGRTTLSINLYLDKLSLPESVSNDLLEWFKKDGFKVELNGKVCVISWIYEGDIELKWYNNNTEIIDLNAKDFKKYQLSLFIDKIKLGFDEMKSSHLILDLEKLGLPKIFEDNLFRALTINGYIIMVNETSRKWEITNIHQ